LYGDPDSLVGRMSAFFFQYIKRKKRINVLDIGGGDGKRLRQILDLLRENKISARATLVEPSKILTDDCRKAVKGSRYGIKVARSLFEDFESGEKYDLILMIHSYFTFPDASVFEKISRLLKKDGILFVAGNEVDSFLAKLNFKTKESRTIFAGCLKNNELTKNGRLLASWIALSDYPKIPEKMKQELADVFRKNSKGSKIAEKEIFVIAWK
jgi:SAM-dependent methyltransferase